MENLNAARAAALARLAPPSEAAAEDRGGSALHDAPLRAAVAAGVGADAFLGPLRTHMDLPGPMRGPRRDGSVPPAVSPLGSDRNFVAQPTLLSGGAMSVTPDGRALRYTSNLLTSEAPFATDRAGPRHIGLSPGMEEQLGRSARAGMKYELGSGWGTRHAPAAAAMRYAAPLTSDAVSRVPAQTDMVDIGRRARAQLTDLYDQPRKPLQFSKGGPFVSAMGYSRKRNLSVPFSMMQLALSDSAGPLLAAEAERRGMLASGPPHPYLDSEGTPRLYLCSYLGSPLTLMWRAHAQTFAHVSQQDMGVDKNGRLLQVFGAFLNELLGAHAREDTETRTQQWVSQNEWYALPAPRGVVEAYFSPATTPGFEGAEDAGTPAARALHVVHPDLVEALGRVMNTPV